MLRRTLVYFLKKHFIFFQPGTCFQQNIINFHQLFLVCYFALICANNKKPLQHQNLNKTLFRTDRDRNTFWYYLLFLSCRASFVSCLVSQWSWHPEYENLVWCSLKPTHFSTPYIHKTVQEIHNFISSSYYSHNLHSKKSGIHITLRLLTVLERAKLLFNDD